MNALWIAAPLLCSLTASAAAEVFRDIAYDASPGAPAARQLDVYTPGRTGSSRPVVVYVHGGGGSRGDRAAVGRKPEWLTSQGFVLVSVGYRLGEDGRHPAASEDIATALLWLRTHIADYGGDPAALFLMGHSSGGHLAALVATDSRFSAPGLLAGVLCIDANAFDLETLITMLEPEHRGPYLENFGDQPSAWREASPIHLLAPGRETPPFLLLVAGFRDSTHLQAALFARRLETAGRAVTLEVFPEQTHGSINALLGTPAHRPSEAVEKYLHSVLGPGRPAP